MLEIHLDLIVCNSIVVSFTVYGDKIVCEQIFLNRGFYTCNYVVDAY